MMEKVTIIGSGPAAFTAAIYAARANLNPLLYMGAPTYENQITGTLPLGQLNLTTEVENFPGFPAGIRGPELMLAMQQQAEKFGTRTVMKDILRVDVGRPFVLEDSDGDIIESESVIVATGASAKYPKNLPGLDDFRNGGVSACAVCDGALPRYKDKVVAVIGGGDSACEEAIYLTKYASKVLLIHRRDVLRASQIMARRALSNPKIQPLWNTVVTGIFGTPEDGVQRLGIETLSVNSDPGDFLTVGSADIVGVFFAIGHTPNTKFLPTEKFDGQGGLAERVYIDEAGFIVNGNDPEYDTMTSVNGIFAAGDVTDPKYKQAITAAGSGCKAALDAERWLHT